MHTRKRSSTEADCQVTREKRRQDRRTVPFPTVSALSDHPTLVGCYLAECSGASRWSCYARPCLFPEPRERMPGRKPGDSARWLKASIQSRSPRIFSASAISPCPYWLSRWPRSSNTRYSWLSRSCEARSFLPSTMEVSCHLGKLRHHHVFRRLL